MSTIVSRLLLDHPDLGETKGAALHTKVRTGWSKIGDNLNSRFFTANIAGSGGTVDLEHNFKVAIGELNAILYSYNTGTGLSTRMVSGGSPDLDDFTIVATAGFETTKITVTNNSGGAEDVSIVLIHGESSGSGGDPSFNVSSLTSAGIIKYLAGTIGDDVDGVEFQIAADTTEDISAVVTIDGDYNIYMDRTLLPAAAVVLGRKVITVVPATHFIYSTTANDDIDRIRYKHIGGFDRTGGGTFGNPYTAAQNSKGGPAQLQAVEYEQGPTTIGSVGTADQIQAGHNLDVSSFDFSLAANVGSFWNLRADALDDSVNSENLTQNGSPVFTGIGINGLAGAADLDGSTDYFSRAGTFADTLNRNINYSFGAWIALNDWTPASNQTPLSIGTAGLSPVMQFRVAITTGNLQVSDAAGLRIDLPQSFVDGDLHHFVIVQVATDRFKLYIDGEFAVDGVNTSGSDATGAVTIGIGAVGNSGGEKTAGIFEQAFLIKQLLSDDQIRKIYSARIDHNRNVPVANQAWSGSEAILNGPTFALENYETGRNQNSIYVDLASRASTNLVSLTLLNTGANGSAIAARSREYADTATAIDALMPLSHNLGIIPSMILEVEDGAGQFREDDNGTYFTKSSTQIISTGTTLASVVGGATLIKLRLSSGPQSTIMPGATTTIAGILEANKSIYRRLAASDNILANEIILSDSSGGIFTLTLPASPSDGDTIDVWDDTLSWGANNVTIARNGKTIQTVASDLVLNASTQSTARYTFVYQAANNDWRVYIS